MLKLFEKKGKKWTDRISVTEVFFLSKLLIGASFSSYRGGFPSISNGNVLGNEEIFE